MKGTVWHKLSEKFKFHSNKTGNRIPRVQEIINLEDVNDSEAESFQMPSTYLTPVIHMYKVVELLKR